MKIEKATMGIGLAAITVMAASLLVLVADYRAEAENHRAVLLARGETALDALTAGQKSINEQLNEFKKLDLVEFTNQHERMKANLNKFAGTTNVNVVDTTNIFLDTARRINEIEARLEI